MNLSVENIYLLSKPKGSVKAFAAINLDGISIRNIPIIDGPNGLHVLPPSIHSPETPNKPKRYIRIVDFKEKAEDVSQAIIEAYKTMLADTASDKQPEE